ncbi:MAG TPA: hypothetical protein DEP35_01820 [Deltaproteobacteria bacterium]|nr:hypothetical protein [Deltaproteobacteria bacterium]
MRFVQAIAARIGARLLRSQNEEALRASETRFQALTEHSSDIITVLDPDGRLLYCSLSARIFGYEPGELLGRSTFDYIHPDDRARVGRAFGRALRGDTVGLVEEFRFRHTDGSWRTLEAVISNLLDVPAVRGLVVNSRDITERRRAEEALRDSETRFRALIENCMDVVVVLDAEGRITYRSPSVVLLGYQPQELLGRVIFDYVHPDDRLRARQSFARAFQGDVIGLREECRFRHKDGSWRTFETVVTNMLAEPSVAGLVINARDITERVRADARLRAQERQLQAIVGSVNDVVLELDGDGRYLNVWASDESELARPRAELLDRTIEEVLGVDVAARFTKPLRRVLVTGVPERIEYPLALADGEHWFLGRLTRLPGIDGGPDTICMGITDITERKQAEEALRESEAELARSNRDLEQFAYVASHDLQEPLRMVTSYVQLLARRYKGKLDSDADEFIVFAMDGAIRMWRLINDLLAYSRVRTEGSEIESTNCEAVLRQALDNLKTSMEENGAVVTHDGLPTVFANSPQLIQLFQNLIGNAIKFRGSEPPRIHVSASRNGNGWTFAVRDNGIGIAPEYAKRIFILFQRLHSREKYSGTGIGLAICQKIVERHGGHIWVESELGKGATFYFTLPASERDSAFS